MNLFERLARNQPPPAEEKKQPRKDLADAQRMLDWLQLRWNRPTVTSCQIYQFAPRSLRFDRENAIKTAELLAQLGWLVAANKTQQRGRREWQVIRRPTIYPQIAE
jgi:hypothetical protein